MEKKEMLLEPEELREEAKKNRVFSHEQMNMISRWEEACGKSGCDDDGHKCDED